MRCRSLVCSEMHYISVIFPFDLATGQSVDCPIMPACPNSSRNISSQDRREWISMREQWRRSEEHTSELQSLMRTSYAVFCLKKKTKSRQKSKNRNYKHH